jgi:GntR family transcriptional regulator
MTIGAKDDFVLEPLNDTSLAERVRKMLLDAILDQRFKDRLPPEDVLAEMLNVSRTTIRTALQSLEEHGVVNRKRAVGTTVNTHVRPSALALQRLVGFDAVFRDKGYQVKVQIEWERASLPHEVLSMFDVSPDSEYLVTLKNYVVSGRVAMMIRDVVPWNALKNKDFDEPVPASLFDFSRRHCTTPIDHAVVQLTALARSADVRTSLTIEEGAAFVRLNETHFSRQGEPLAYSAIDVDNEFVTFEVFRRG